MEWLIRFLVAATPAVIAAIGGYFAAREGALKRIERIQKNYASAPDGSRTKRAWENILESETREYWITSQPAFQNARFFFLFSAVLAIAWFVLSLVVILWRGPEKMIPGTIGISIILAGVVASGIIGTFVRARLEKEFRNLA